MRDCLSRGTTDLAPRYFKASAHPVRRAWHLSVGGDLALPEIDEVQSLSARLFHGYVDRVLAAAEFDAAALNQFVRVTTLVDPPARLLRPALLWRAAAATCRAGFSMSRTTPPGPSSRADQLSPSILQAVHTDS